MVYDNIRRLCDERGVKITALLEEIGMSTGTASKWKQGGLPSRPTLAKIAAYFGVTVKDLLAETPPAIDSAAVPAAPVFHDDITDEDIATGCVRPTGGRGFASYLEHINRNGRPKHDVKTLSELKKAIGLVLN